MNSSTPCCLSSGRQLTSTANTGGRTLTLCRLGVARNADDLVLVVLEEVLGHAAALLASDAKYNYAFGCHSVVSRRGKSRRGVKVSRELGRGDGVGDGDRRSDTYRQDLRVVLTEYTSVSLSYRMTYMSEVRTYHGDNAVNMCTCAQSPRRKLTSTSCVTPRMARVERRRVIARTSETSRFPLLVRCGQQGVCNEHSALIMD